MKNIIPTVLAFLAVSTFTACGDDSSSNSDSSTHAHESAHAHEGAHGGELVELGSAAHIEFVREEATGKVTLYITGKDGKTPLPIADAPELKLATDAGQKVLPTTAANSKGGKSSEFTAMHETLKAHELTVRISVKVGGKLFNPDIEEHHDHNHK